MRALSRLPLAIASRVLGEPALYVLALLALLLWLGMSPGLLDDRP
jgi:hypothetical protein